MSEQAVGQDVGAPQDGRRWRRPLLLTLGGVVGVGVALAVGASIASASPHRSAAVSSSASSGVTLCAKHSGAVIYEKTSKCPRGDTKLSVGDQSQVSKLSSEVTTLRGDVTSLTAKNATLTSKESTDAGDITTLQGQVSMLSSEHTADASDISALQTLLTGFSRGTAGGNPLLTISGENVQINDGGGTEAVENGLGNLLIGYNENPGTQTGSNNLVLGDGQTFTSYGGIIAGQNNLLSGPFADVLGDGNSATGNSASVTGGENNTASGSGSSILGGNGVSVSASDQTAPTGVVGSVTGSVGFSLGANACGAFSVGDSALELGDVPLFAYTTTPPSEAVLFTPGAVTTAGQAKFTACNDSSSSVTFSGSIHLVAFRG